MNTLVSQENGSNENFLKNAKTEVVKHESENVKESQQMTALKRPNIPFMGGKQATNVKLHSNFKYKRKLVEILQNVLQKQKRAQL